MVGDDLVNDVGGAQKCGLMGILVRTGKYRYTLHLSLLTHSIKSFVDLKMNITVM